MVGKRGQGNRRKDTLNLKESEICAARRSDVLAQLQRVVLDCEVSIKEWGEVTGQCRMEIFLWGKHLGENTSSPP